jgi:hypothetical protein
MCQKDQYMTSIYLLTGSLTIFSSGLFILLAMGKIHTTDRLKDRNAIRKANQPVLPTNTLKFDPHYKKSRNWIL